MSTIHTNASLADVAKAIRAMKKDQKGTNGVYYVGAVIDPFDGDKRYDFGGALECDQIDPSNNVFDLVIGNHTAWPVQPVAPYTFEVLAPSDAMPTIAAHYPLTPERCKAFWPDWEEAPAAAPKAKAEKPKAEGTPAQPSAQAKGFSTKVQEPQPVVDARKRLQSFSQTLNALSESDPMHAQLAEMVVAAQAELDKALAAWEAEKAAQAEQARLAAEEATRKAEYDRRVAGAVAKQQELIHSIEMQISTKQQQLVDDDDADTATLRAEIKQLRLEIAAAQTELDDLPALVEKQLAAERQARIDEEARAAAALQALEDERLANAKRRAIQDAIELLQREGYEITRPDTFEYPPEVELSEPVVAALNAALNDTLGAMQELGVQELSDATPTEEVAAVEANAQERGKRRR